MPSGVWRGRAAKEAKAPLRPPAPPVHFAVLLHQELHRHLRKSAFTLFFWVRKTHRCGRTWKLVVFQSSPSRASPIKARHVSDSREEHVQGALHAVIEPDVRRIRDLTGLHRNSQQDVGKSSFLPRDNTISTVLSQSWISRCPTLPAPEGPRGEGSPGEPYSRGPPLLLCKEYMKSISSVNQYNDHPKGGNEQTRLRNKCGLMRPITSPYFKLTDRLP